MSRYLLLLALTAASAAMLPRAPDADTDADANAGAAVAAALVAARDSRTPGLVSFPIVERRELKGPATRLEPRRNNEVLHNMGNVAFMIPLMIGLPQQMVRLELDTGSSEMWVNPNCSTVVDEASQELCESVWPFEPSESISLVNTNESTVLEYKRGKAEVEYVLDDVAMTDWATNKGEALKNMKFGVALASDDAPVPICGVGFGNNYNLKYNNFVDELMLQGFTNSRTISLVLGAVIQPFVNGSTLEDWPGTVIFGGIDTRLFVGPLYKFNNLPPQADDPGQPWRYWIQMDSVGFNKADTKVASTYKNSSVAVVLDSGSTFSYLPQNIIDDLAKSFGAEAQSDGSLIVDCAISRDAGFIDFTFGELLISIPLYALIWQAASGLCYVAALPSTSSVSLLGNTFLIWVYVLFDQDHQHIYMARALSCGSNMQALSGDGDYNFTGLCNWTPVAAAAAASLAPFSAMALLALVGVQALLSWL
ncbi:MAG: hypothetical protein STHCBS139747_006728 [Sporothrix thermara]